MKTTIRLLAILATLGLALSVTNADYFHDQGFVDAEYRTDFNSKTEGTLGNQLTYDDATPNPPNSCLFPAEFCGYKPKIGNAYWYGSSASVWNAGAEFWVLSVNNEPAFENSATAFDGLPNQVHQLYSNTSQYWTYTPASFAVVTDTPAGENYPRAHMIVRHYGYDKDEHNWLFSNDKNGIEGIPFISIGAQKNRGNGSSDIGALNSSTRPDTVKFKAKVWNFVKPNPPPSSIDNYGEDADGGLWFLMYAITEWGGKKRGLFINLKHVGNLTDWSTSFNDGTYLRWNWPIGESFFHPGVDFAYIDTEDFGYAYPIPYYPNRCYIPSSKAPQMTSTGVDYQFELDLTELFRCASARGLFETAMPSTTELPILGVHWGVELSGWEGHIWASVHDMKMQ